MRRTGSRAVPSSSSLDLRHVVPPTRTGTCSAPCSMQLSVQHHFRFRQVPQHPPALHPLVHINTALCILSSSRLDSCLHEHNSNMLSTYRHSCPPEERHSHVPGRSPIQFVRLPLSPFPPSFPLIQLSSHHVWLRDHCQEPRSCHPATKQRLVDTASVRSVHLGWSFELTGWVQISRDIKPESVRVVDAGIQITCEPSRQKLRRSN